MSTGITQIYSLPYPILTDEVNVHGDIQVLAETTENILLSKADSDDLNSKAPIANPTFTGTVSGITKSMVGLGNVDNTSDLNKPISTATQTELSSIQTSLNSKAPLASPSFTGNISSGGDINLASGKSYKVNNVAISTTLPGLTWGEVKNGKSSLVIS